MQSLLLNNLSEKNVTATIKIMNHGKTRQANAEVNVLHAVVTGDDVTTNITLFMSLSLTQKIISVAYGTFTCILKLAGQIN